MENVDVCVFGAGSIGTHLSQAARSMGWSVHVVDPDEAALQRMRDDLYPARYGKWDELITQSVAGQGDRFDVICIGTPPDVRLSVACDVLEKNPPKVMLLEKPLCVPNDPMLPRFLELVAQNPDSQFLVGYNHATTDPIRAIVDIIRSGELGSVTGIDVHFRENPEGILRAHPWLTGIEDTYLGYTARGGGASGEHSHALQMLFYIAWVSGWGDLSEWELRTRCEFSGKPYDSVFEADFASGSRRGRVVQDLLARPHRKWMYVQFERGSIEWKCGIPLGGSLQGDMLTVNADGDTDSRSLPMARPIYFRQEMVHIGDLLDGTVCQEDSPISLVHGLRVMDVLSHNDRTRGGF